MKKTALNRYLRQTTLPGLGTQGQQKIQAASVLVIGAGGLGCPALQYLAAAGVGHIGIADPDTVALSNLNRQTLYTPHDIGKPKAKIAAKRLQKFNPHLKISVYQQQITNQNALQILPLFDVVIDGTDNFAARYMLSDACALLQKPLVYGAVYQFEGQVAVFNLPDAPTISYRTLFPHPPTAEQAPNCINAGVLGILPGITGTMQAAETLKIITGLGKPLSGSLLTFNILQQVWYRVNIPPQTISPNPAPQTIQAFKQFNYPLFCHSPIAQNQISSAQFTKLLAKKNTLFIDVRNEDELPLITQFAYINIPLTQLPDGFLPHATHQTIVFFCQTGRRSQSAAQSIGTLYPQYRVYSLKKGIAHWLQKQSGKKK